MGKFYLLVDMHLGGSAINEASLRNVEQSLVRKTPSQLEFFPLKTLTFIWAKHAVTSPQQAAALLQIAAV